MKSLCLFFTDGRWSQNDGKILTGPVDNHEEAVELINQHLKQHVVLKKIINQ